MEKKTIEKVKTLLNKVKEDVSVPKNVREKIESVISLLNDDIEFSIKMSKVLHELDEISLDMNLSPYTRTQLWNVISFISILEKKNFR